MAEGGCPRAIRGVLWGDKVERPMEVVSVVEEWDGVGPGDVFGGCGCDGWFEFHALEVFDDAVGGCAVAVPDGPPPTILFG